VRPTRLEVQGLTAYKERVEIDFSDLDLFAITGPTGAGKSSLVDAITYALFGEVPRVGDSVKQLISQGEERLRVNLEFAADGQSYRVHRSTGLRGVPSVRIDHFDPDTDDWVPDADKVKEVNEHVASILGMDYDGFVRSILLPQGQFQQFLAGKPEERRKVLDGLLRLDIYQQMHQRANQIAAEHEQHAATIQQRLDTQYAETTREALRAAKARLAELRAQAEDLSGLRVALAEASQKAQAMSSALLRQNEAKAAIDKAAAELGEQRSLLDSGQAVLTELDAKISATQAELAKTAYDVDVLICLKEALNLSQNLDRSEKRLKELQVELKAFGPRKVKLEEERVAAEECLASASKAVEEAERMIQEAQRENLAGTLRQGLESGDPCPVCGQKVGALPEERHLALDEAKASLQSARKVEAEQHRLIQGATTATAVAEREQESFNKQVSELTSDCDAERKKLNELMAGQEATTTDIAASVRVQDAARREHERLSREHEGLRRERQERAKAIADAGQRIARLEADTEARERDLKAASEEISGALNALTLAAKTNGWPDVAADLESLRDPAPALRSKLTSADAEFASAQQAVGACEARIAAIEQGIAEAQKLRDQIVEARREGGLAKDLAALLRVTGFPNYIREHALRLLAQDGSRQLSGISGGRYEFAVEGQEFLVIDNWNAAEKRSVKTLSGGETFLASLALALALAEHLPGFAAGDSAHALESLFIDEGFSNLDSDTLDIVTSALEAIGQGGNRMVGVITHLPALAERMPARITVRKSQSGSTLAFEQ
jgi:DNA repair protein SbcC/Rad50